MVLSDAEIRERAIAGMITPWAEGTSVVEGSKVISFGITSYGYDVRLRGGTSLLAGHGGIDDFLETHPLSIDPKRIDGKTFHTLRSVTTPCGEERYVIPPHGFLLAESVERIRVPDDLMVIAVGKSTYARCGIICNVTPLEPGWEGTITLELSNTTPLPCVVYANEGVAQLVFLRASRVCEKTYADKGGKYQSQTGVVLPRL